MKKYFLLFLLTIALAASVSAQTKVNVHFARGANSTRWVDPLAATNTLTMWSEHEADRRCRSSWHRRAATPRS